MTDEQQQKTLPRYPVYVPSKGRYESGYTARTLIADGVPFSLVVEREEADEYASRYPQAQLLVLPESGQGLIYARNWIKEHATATGAARHWQLDDNMMGCVRMWKGKKIPCSWGLGLRVCEDLSDRYTNVAISGLNYRFFNAGRNPPFFVNNHVYSCTLVNNAIPHRWRLRYNDDTDMCLQVLADGWCTILVNAFLANKLRTMVVSGGNTDDLYQGDGRLRMARQLERVWPGVVSTDRRFKRPQHVVKDQWRRFDTPLQLRDDVKLDELAATDEYGMQLRQIAEIKSENLRRLVRQAAEQSEAPATEQSQGLDGAQQ